LPALTNYFFQSRSVTENPFSFSLDSAAKFSPKAHFPPPFLAFGSDSSPRSISWASGDSSEFRSLELSSKPVSKSSPLLDFLFLRTMPCSFR